MAPQLSSTNERFCLFERCSLFVVSVFFFAGIVACGGHDLFGGEDEKNEPPAETTVTPPVPIAGSYITSVLVDENNLPVAQAEVRTKDGQLFSRTDGGGLFQLPIALMQDESFDLDVKRNGEEVPLRLNPCPHMLAAISALAGTDGVEASLVMAVRVSSNAAIPSNDEGAVAPGRLLVDSIAAPKGTLSEALNDAPLLRFKLESPLSGSTIAPDFVLTGECAVGYLVKVFGDVATSKEVTCTDNSGRGSFSVNVSAKNENGLNAVVFEHVQPTTNILVSQEVLFNTAP